MEIIQDQTAQTWKLSIQGIYDAKGSDSLISKIGRIFVLSLSCLYENLSAFLHNQREKVCSLFGAKKEVKQINLEKKIEKTKKVQDSSAISPKSSSIASKLPFIGIGLGLGLSLMMRTIHQIPASAKCFKYRDFIFKGVNSLKQNEIKNFALLSALIPLTYNMIQDVRGQKERSLFQKIKTAATRQFLTKEFAFFSIVSTLALLNPLYAKPLGLSNGLLNRKTKFGTCFPHTRDFDSSGHVMIKTVMAQIMSNIIAKTSLTNTTFAALFSLGYAATDAVFMYNTAYLCHKVSETLAGLAWAGAIIGIGKAKKV